MFRKFLVCVAPSELHTLHMVARLRAEGFSNARIRAFLGLGRAIKDSPRSETATTGTPWAPSRSEGAFSSLGFPEIEALRFERKVREGRIVLCVQTDDDPDEMESIMQIFQEAQGEEISSISEAPSRPVNISRLV